MKFLQLTIKKKWFDMILSGEKTEEYREIKPHWITRLTNQRGETARPQSTWKINKIDAVCFYNGAYYSKDLPNFAISVDSVEIGQGRKEWGAEVGVDYFIIKLGVQI